jgi:hypothetical protein
MQSIAHAISPRAARKYQSLFNERDPLKRQEREKIRLDWREYNRSNLTTGALTLKRAQHPDMRQHTNFSTTFYQESQASTDQISILKATEYSMLAQYSRYLQEINDLQNQKPHSHIQKQKTANRIKELEQKLESCSTQNLIKIKKDLAKNKTHAYYRRKAVEYTVYAKCSHILANSSTALSEKERRKKLYQIVRNDWANSARRAYWPRLFGGSIHITGGVLNILSACLGQTAFGLTAHFLMGFSRVISDATMGAIRLDFKAFEEINNNYIFFKPAGALDSSECIQDVHLSFKKSLDLINTQDHPNLAELLKGGLSTLQINKLLKKFNTDEIKLAHEIKKKYKELRAARHREKIESTGSMGQLRNNLSLGVLQLTLNTLKFIPSMTLQIAIAAINTAGSIAQHTLNYVTAPDDFCRKMEQNCISQLNLSHHNNAFKIELQQSLQELKSEKNIKAHHISQKIHTIFDSNIDLKEGLMKSITAPLEYRLKNLLEYQSIIIMSKVHEQNKRREKIDEIISQLQKIMPYKQMEEKDLEEYIKHLDGSQRIDSIKSIQQREWIQKIANLKRIMQADQIALDYMELDFQYLKSLSNPKSLETVEKALAAIHAPKLKKALHDAGTAIELIIEGKKMLKNERLRYFVSYFAPSALGFTILTPLLVTSATLPSGTPEQVYLKNTNSCVVNLVAAGQQLITGSNNAKRDEYREGLKKVNSSHQSNQIYLRTDTKYKINDTRGQFTPSPEVKNQQQKLTFKFFMDCALAPITAPIQHIKAAKTVQKYDLAISYLNV